MIRCKVEVFCRKPKAKKKDWHEAVKLGAYKRVEDARKAMFAVHRQYGVPARLMSQFGTVVDATYIDDPNAG